MGMCPETNLSRALYALNYIKAIQIQLQAISYKFVFIFIITVQNLKMHEYMAPNNTGVTPTLC